MPLTKGNSYLFDTGIFIKALRRRDPAHDRARQLLRQAVVEQISVGYSVITEAELWVGISAAHGRTEAEHTLLLSPFRRLAIIVPAIPRRAGEIRRLLNENGVGRTDGPQLMDCLIIATAERYRLTLFTTDRNHFAQLLQHRVSDVNVEYL
jgi:predicted nucleic acid-binding protein